MIIGLLRLELHLPMAQSLSDDHRMVERCLSAVAEWVQSNPAVTVIRVSEGFEMTCSIGIARKPAAGRRRVEQKMLNIRKHRVSQQLQELIAEIIHRELKDPNLGFVTITKVELSNDGSHAKVAYSCLGTDEDRERSKHALERAKGFMRGLLKRRLRLKIIPEISFRFDESIAQSIAMGAKLDTLRDRASDGA